MFEAVQFVESRDIPEPVETQLGVFEDEVAAVEAAREAKQTFMASGSADFAWWVVRRPGARLAQFIADSRNPKEFVLDLTSGQLMEVE